MKKARDGGLFERFPRSYPHWFRRTLSCSLPFCSICNITFGEHSPNRPVTWGKRTNTYKKPEGLTYISSEPLMPTTEGLIYTIIQNHYCIQIARTTITYNRRTNIHKNVVQNHYYLQPEGLTPTRKKHHVYKTTIVHK